MVNLIWVVNLDYKVWDWFDGPQYSVVFQLTQLVSSSENWCHFFLLIITEFVRSLLVPGNKWMLLTGFNH